MKILAIDYGKKRIGLSISDSSGKIALMLDTYNSVSIREDVEFIKSLISEKGVELVVIGLPLNMNGSEGKRVALTKKFGEIVKKATEIQVEFIDERLTSIEAENILGYGYKTKNVNKGDVDKIAAMLILQSYLDRRI